MRIFGGGRNLGKGYAMKQRIYEAGAARVHACNCIGPQNGNPVCPCAMRSVSIQNGRYVQINDLGPAPAKPEAFDLEWLLNEGFRNGHD